MTDRLENTEEIFLKRIRLQMVVIGVLTIGMLSVVFYFFFLKARWIDKSTHSERFIEEVDELTANGGLANYADIVRVTSIHNSQGVFYDTADIRKYIDSTFGSIIQRHSRQHGAALPAGYQWKVGFYWKVGDDPDKKRGLGFYVVPVIYDSKNKKVLDYFNSGYNRFYNHAAGDTDPKNIYDEGHLWP